MAMHSLAVSVGRRGLATSGEMSGRDAWVRASSTKEPPEARAPAARLVCEWSSRKRKGAQGRVARAVLSCRAAWGGRRLAADEVTFGCRSCRRELGALRVLVQGLPLERPYARVLPLPVVRRDGLLRCPAKGVSVSGVASCGVPFLAALAKDIVLFCRVGPPLPQGLIREPASWTLGLR